MANTSVDGVTKNSDAVARYAFCAPDSVEGKDRDFELMVLQDRTCFWEDVQGRLAIRQDKFLTVKSLIGDTAAEAELKREREQCTFASKIGEDAYLLLKKKESMSAEEIATADELCERLDWVLAPYFWRDVNPKLANPLTKLPKTF